MDVKPKKKEEQRKEKLIWDNFTDLRAAVNVPSFHPQLHSSVRCVIGGHGPGVVSGCAPKPLKKKKRYVASAGENKQPPRFILPSLGAPLGPASSKSPRKSTH